jgi:hypothetical protein
MLRWNYGKEKQVPFLFYNLGAKAASAVFGISGFVCAFHWSDVLEMARSDFYGRFQDDCFVLLSIDACL